MKKALLAGLLFLFPAGLSMAATEPLSIAAEYYFSRGDFRQALHLWGEVLRRQPDSVSALYRTAELKLMFEGRVAVRDTIVGFLSVRRDSLPAETERMLEEKLGRLESTFLTDDGQSIFFQALPKARAKDCQTAVDLFAQVDRLEGGNLRVLKEKASCEKTLGVFERYYDTLKLAYDRDPYDSEVVEQLSEAHDYHGLYDRTVAMFRKDPAALRTVRQKIAFGIALAETGEGSEAITLLQSVVAADKQNRFPPVVYESLGRALAARGDGLAVNYLERFLIAAARPDVAQSGGWDPYRTVERVEDAKALVASIKASRQR